MTEFKPIETRYAGCRFRSRLEARWAVFFDALGIQWQYEPQGFRVGGRAYLPDFLLTDSGTWVEVKGREEDLDHRLILEAAWALPENRPRHEAGPRLMILGPIPPEPKGDWGWIGLRPEPEFGEDVVHDAYFGFGAYCKNLRPWWLSTSCATPVAMGERSGWLTPAIDPSEYGAEHAYRAARSARFEHGESG